MVYLNFCKRLCVYEPTQEKKERTSICHQDCFLWPNLCGTNGHDSHSWLAAQSSFLISAHINSSALIISVHEGTFSLQRQTWTSIKICLGMYFFMKHRIPDQGQVSLMEVELSDTQLHNSNGLFGRCVWPKNTEMHLGSEMCACETSPTLNLAQTVWEWMSASIAPSTPLAVAAAKNFRVSFSVLTCHFVVLCSLSFPSVNLDAMPAVCFGTNEGTCPVFMMRASVCLSHKGDHRSGSRAFSKKIHPWRFCTAAKLQWQVEGTHTDLAAFPCGALDMPHCTLPFVFGCSGTTAVHPQWIPPVQGGSCRMELCHPFQQGPWPRDKSIHLWDQGSIQHLVCVWGGEVARSCVGMIVWSLAGEFLGETTCCGEKAKRSHSSLNGCHTKGCHTWGIGENFVLRRASMLCFLFSQSTNLSQQSCIEIFRKNVISATLIFSYAPENIRFAFVFSGIRSFHDVRVHWLLWQCCCPKERASHRLRLKGTGRKWGAGRRRQDSPLWKSVSKCFRLQRNEEQTTHLLFLAAKVAIRRFKKSFLRVVLSGHLWAQNSGLGKLVAEVKGNEACDWITHYLVQIVS